jgi:cytochrome b
MSATEGQAAVRVWDPAVRVGHWALAALFAVAYLTEGEPEWLHVWAGYGLAAIVAFRVVWGFVGPRRARFADFVTGPGWALAYLRDLVAGRAPRFVGHSPAGGAMVVALLLALSLTAFTGMATLAVHENEGPLAPLLGGPAPVIEGFLPPVVAPALADADDEGQRGEREDSVWEEAHELFANLSLALVIAHVAGVVLASVMHRENLVRAMVTGRKRA